jgi:hypothetical protein
MLMGLSTIMMVRAEGDAHELRHARAPAGRTDELRICGGMAPSFRRA